MIQRSRVPTKVNGRTTKCMVTAFTDGAQASFTLDIGSIVKNMEVVDSTSKEEIYTKVSSKTINVMGMVTMFGLIKENTKAGGIRASSMV